MRFRVRGLVPSSIILVAILLTGCMPAEPEVSRLTAALRVAYGLPPAKGPFPIATFDEVIPGGVTPDSVAVLLEPVADQVVSERWVTGRDGSGDKVQSHIVGFRVPQGTRFEVAFVYRQDRLIDIDLPEYLGRTEAFEPVEGGWPRLLQRAT